MHPFFIITFLLLTLQIFLLLYSAMKTKDKFWPPQNKKQLYVSWLLFYPTIIFLIIVGILTFNSWILSQTLSYFIGYPLFFAGSAISIWAILTVGIKNTHTMSGNILKCGIYKYMRHPQYKGNMMLFAGSAILVNSAYYAILAGLLCLLFLLMTKSEEFAINKQ